MIVNVNHTAFTVSDLNRSITFYNKLLGLSIIDIADRSIGFSEKVTGIENAHMKIAYLDAFGHTLELIEYIFPKGEKKVTRTCDIGVTHIAFNVKNIQEMYNRLKKNEVKFKSEPVEIPAGPNKGGFTVYLEDPDGIGLEFIEPSN
jgi:catechol 2,3-dioxygenase-like lactoylglutathione lyase family enzyme